MIAPYGTTITNTSDSQVSDLNRVKAEIFRGLYIFLFQYLDVMLFDLIFFRKALPDRY